MVQKVSNLARKVAFVAFAKDPEAIPVKTRLARSVGQAGADIIYLAMLEDCLQELCSAKYADTFLACYPNDNSDLFKQLAIAYDITLIKQAGTDLGERMYSCAFSILQEYDTVFLFGTDLPIIPVETIRVALSTRGWDVLFGPCKDGGFYTIGFRKLVAKIFVDVDWDTDSSLIQTVRNCVSSELEVLFIDLCTDIDDLDSLRYWQSRLARTKSGAEHTRAAVKNLKLG